MSIRGARLGKRIGNCHQLDIEDQLGLRWNRRTSGFAVGELIRNEQAPFAADLESLESEIPSGDHAPVALREADRVPRPAVLRGVARRIEPGAVRQPARVVHVEAFPRSRHRARSDGDLRPPERKSDLLVAGDLGNRSRELLAATPASRDEHEHQDRKSRSHGANVRLGLDGIPDLAGDREIPRTMMPLVLARRVLSADRRGSSWPVLVETDQGVRFTKLRGAAQGTGPLVAEVIVASVAEALGLRVPERSLVTIEPGVESLDRNGELRHLLDVSEGLNLGFAYLDGGRVLRSAELESISTDDAAAIVWLDRFVMNPDRTDRNPNLMWWRDRLWLIDHGAALGFQYAWSMVSEESPQRTVASFEPHVLRGRLENLREWDDVFSARLGREVIDAIVLEVPDSFLLPMLAPSDRDDPDAVRRRRAAYSAFLWKRLKAPRDWATTPEIETPRERRGPPSWVTNVRRR